MAIFATTVAFVVLISAFCSISEASVYAVRRPFIRGLVDQGSVAGSALERFKDNMERPIAAILVINTAANTAGAALAGAQASALFGSQALAWFSALFTLAVLFLSEIIPKILGVVYNRGVARAVAIPWSAAITLLTPLIWVVDHISALIKPAGKVFAAPEEEVMQLAQISAAEGSISEDEAAMVRNVLALDTVDAHSIMTPRTVVSRLPSNMTVGEASEHVAESLHSRIPIYDPDDQERWTGLVRTADVLASLVAGHVDITLATLGRPLPIVSDSVPCSGLLQRFIDERTHLFGVADEFGGMAGVVSLEDVVEAIVGREIVDEVDQDPDLREVARRRRR
jgi:CBS domain containing-hemolysin-like protein